MKKLLISTLLLFSVLSISSQTIKIGKTFRIEPEGFYPVLNAEGNLLAFSAKNYEGLDLYLFSDKSVQKISDEEGAGFQPRFSEDGKLFYRNTIYISKLRYERLKCLDLRTATIKEEREPQRFRSMQPLGVDLKKDFPVVWSDGKNLNIMKDGETEILNPIENANGYIWASLSPNRQMILFNAVAVGTFVSDLNGNIIASLGYLNAAVWYNNEFVVGMQDKDDGQHITESAIILKNLAGNVNKKLSKSGMIAMFPTASSAGKKIAYNTIEGDIFVLELDIIK